MAIDPARFGMPNATTTGVQPGTTLKPYTGPMTITTDGAVIENVIINGMLTVDADNVTIRNCVVQNFSWYGIMQNVDNGATNLRIEHCDINGLGSSRTTGVAIGGGSSALIGCDITGMVIAVKVWGPAVIKDNYVHDLNEPSTNPADRHFDGISLLGGGNTTIEHNSIIMPSQNGGTAAVFLSSQQGNISNVTVRDNLLVGEAAYTVYAEKSGGGSMSGIVIDGNYIERGIYGYINVVGNTPTITNNVLWQEGVNPTPYPTAPQSPPTLPDPTPPQYEHTFVGTSGNDSLTSNGLSNAWNEAFYGLAGNDTLAGGAGGDTMDGGSGTDTATYAGSTAGVTINLQAGTASGGYATGDTVTGIENLTGSSWGDWLTGNSANNVLNGAAGADTMRGMAGNDVYVVDNQNDIVDESLAGSNGIDTVQTINSFSLATAARVLGAVENLTLLGTGNVNGSGNALNNVITGNGGANRLAGGAGNDTLNGGAGNDILEGGAGNDMLTGGSGYDTFLFNSALSAATNIDRITDFNSSFDTFQLENAVFTSLTSTGTLARGAFYVGAAAHDATDRIIYNPTTGALTYDSNGNATGGATQIATLSVGLSLTRSDFEVV